jgi:hypothetical protein
MQNSQMFFQFFNSLSRRLPNEQITIKNPPKNKTYLDSRIVKIFQKLKNVLRNNIYAHLGAYLYVI